MFWRRVSNNNKSMTNILLKSSIIVIFILLIWVSFLNEWLFYKTSVRTKYLIEVEYLNGNKDTISATLPKNMQFQINTYSTKKHTIILVLQAIPKRNYLFRGHWKTITYILLDTD